MPNRMEKIRGWHKALKGECVRPGTLLLFDDARRPVEGYVTHYSKQATSGSVPVMVPL